MTRVSPIESVLEIVATSWFAGCVAVSLWLLAPATEVELLALVAGGGALAFAGGLKVIQELRPPEYRVRRFDLVEIHPTELDELLLTDVAPRAETPVEELVLTLEQRLGVRSERAAPSAELLLEDVLKAIEPESRVIRLFDPAAMPTAGELQSRIDRHLEKREAAAFPDAAQALNDALADLRRSLR